MNATLLDTQVNTKDIKTLVQNIKDIKEKGDDNFFENILKTILDGIGDDKIKNFLLEKITNSLKDSKNLEDFIKVDKLLSTFSKGELKLESDDTNSKIGEVLVEDLLKLSFMLKNNIDVKDFKTDSKELKICCHNKTALQEFKSAKNIKELLDVAKKYDVKVKNIQFFKEEMALETSGKQAIQTIKSADVFKLIENKLQTTKANFIKNLEQDVKPKYTLKSVLLAISDKKDEVNAKDSKVINAKQTVEKDIKIEKQKVLQKDKIVEVTTTKSDNNQKVVTLEKVIQTMPKAKTEIKNSGHINKNEEIKDAKIEKTSELKQENIKDQLIKPVQTKNQNHKVIHEVKNVVTQNNLQSQKEEVVIESSKEEIKTETTHNTHEGQKITTIKHSQAPQEVKKTLNTFAQEFKEQVESYKPPLMKVKMQLNPKGLGEVDVTMINRGNNLHITVTSNHNTISIFSQNQNDFKNSLVNMGFNELSMNFNENGKNKDEQNQKNKNQNSKDFELVSDEESFEMITPLYV